METKPVKWTETLVILTLEDMLEQVYAEEKLAKQKQTLYLEVLFLQRKIPPFYISRWLENYPDNQEISQAIYMLKRTLEYRVADSAMYNRVNSFMAMFLLKNNYGWKEESTVHDDSKTKATEAIDEIRNRLATRTKRNIRNKK